MPSPASWCEVVAIQALLRHARNTYGMAMRQALEAACYRDIFENGLALGTGDSPLSLLVHGLRASKQSARQLVDTPLADDYLR